MQKIQSCSAYFELLKPIFVLIKAKLVMLYKFQYMLPKSYSILDILASIIGKVTPWMVKEMDRTLAGMIVTGNCKYYNGLLPISGRIMWPHSLIHNFTAAARSLLLTKIIFSA